MHSLSSINGLVVSQKKEWGEIATGFETRNKYAISEVSGHTLYLAAEEAGSILLRWFLKAQRPFTIAVLRQDGQAVLRVNRPYMRARWPVKGRGGLIGLVLVARGAHLQCSASSSLPAR